MQVCECLILFMERNEEEFAKFLQTFTQDVWTQLMKVSQAPGQVGAGLEGRVGLRRRSCGSMACFPVLDATSAFTLPASISALQDNLAMHAINFLTAVSRSVHHALFEGADTLRQICESIVIPNLRMREDMVRATQQEVWEGCCGPGADGAHSPCHSLLPPLRRVTTCHAPFLLPACTLPTHPPTD